MSNRKLSMQSVEFIVQCLQAREELIEELAVERGRHRTYYRYRTSPKVQRLQAQLKGLGDQKIADRCGDGCTAEDVAEVYRGNYSEMETIIANRWWKRSLGLNFA